MLRNRITTQAPKTSPIKNLRITIGLRRMVVSSKEIMKLANMALSNPDNTITNTIFL
jgi:hypothetical protein